MNKSGILNGTNVRYFNITILRSSIEIKKKITQNK